MVVGNPDEVIRKLDTFERAGFHQAILFKPAGRIPHQNIMRSIQRIGKYVIPYFNPDKRIAIDVDPQWAAKPAVVAK